MASVSSATCISEPLVHRLTLSFSLEQVFWSKSSPLIQEMGNWTLGCMIHLKASGKFVKTWDPGALVSRLGDFQEGKDERKLNCIHCWVALRCLQTPEWKFLSRCPSSLVLIISANLPPCSSRKAIFRAVSSWFQAQWERPSCSDPRMPSCRW